MSNEQFRVFTNPEFGATVRIAMRNGEYWFMAKDICGYLELGNTGRALSTIDADDKIPLDASFAAWKSAIEANVTQSNVGSTGGSEEVASSETGSNGGLDEFYDFSNGGRAPILISEAGLYALIFKSQKPAAKDFQRWVTHEVLPELRKTGSVALSNSAAAELGKQLEFTTERLVQTNRELGIMQYKHGLATAKLHVLTNLPAPKDVLVNPKKYSSAADVFKNVAGYYMRKNNDKGDSITKLEILLYTTSVAKGYPISIYRRDLVFHKDIVDECVAALKAKAGPKDIDLAFMPGARKKAGVSGMNMSSILMDYSDEEVEEAVDNPSDDDDLTFDI